MLKKCFPAAFLHFSGSRRANYVGADACAAKASARQLSWRDAVAMQLRVRLANCQRTEGSRVAKRLTKRRFAISAAEAFAQGETLYGGARRMYPFAARAAAEPTGQPDQSSGARSAQRRPEQRTDTSGAPLRAAFHLGRTLPPRRSRTFASLAVSLRANLRFVGSSLRDLQRREPSVRCALLRSRAHTLGLLEIGSARSPSRTADGHGNARSMMKKSG